MVGQITYSGAGLEFPADAKAITITVTPPPPQGTMDVTPDDGTPSGGKTSEPSNGGPTGPSTVLLGQNATYSATWTWTGNNPTWSWYVFNSSRVGVGYAHGTFINDGSGIESMSWTAPLAGQPSGTYQVCASGEVSASITQRDEKRSGVFGWLKRLVGEARALTGDSSSSDTECKTVTIGSPSSVDLKVRNPSTGAYQDAAASPGGATRPGGG